MTNDEGNPNVQMTKLSNLAFCHQGFVIRSSFSIRASSFGHEHEQEQE